MSARRRRAFRWLAQEAAYADTKFSEANYEQMQEQIRRWTGIDDRAPGTKPEALNFLLSYLKRAELMGLDTPQGRQALAKVASTVIDYLHHAESVHGPLPKPGVPSGVIEEWVDVDPLDPDDFYVEDYQSPGSKGPN